MTNKLRKYENSIRVAELNPSDTLRKIDASEKSTILDYGAGTGVFTIPASEITNNYVYAYDINEDMLDIINNKLIINNIKNVVLLDGESIEEKIDAITVDIILLVTVYHEIKDKELLFNHFDKLLAKTGKISIIEFHYKDTHMGPPLGHRVKKETLIKEFAKRQYRLIEEFVLGDNFYLTSFVRA